MKIKIPCAKLIKDIDDVTELSHHFLVDCTVNDDMLVIEADEDALLDFLIAYHDVNLQAAKETLSTYADVANRRTFTPEESLQKINEFVLSKGGFDGYDKMFEALNNAINGMI